MNQDEEHLRLLSICTYVVSGLAALFGCVPFLHLGLGVWIILAPHEAAARVGPPPAAFGWLFVVLASIAILLAWAFAIALALAGRFLAQKRHYTYCFVMAAIACAFQPFGTILGVFTIIVLVRPSVKAMFRPHSRPL